MGYNGAFTGPEIDTRLGKVPELESGLNSAQSDILALYNAVGSPLTAATAAAMTDKTKIYVYTGSETGYTAGNWYYWNGSAWTSGGTYNSTAFTADTTLSVSGAAADAASVRGKGILKMDADGEMGISSLSSTTDLNSFNNQAVFAVNSYSAASKPVNAPTADAGVCLFVHLNTGMKQQLWLNYTQKKLYYRYKSAGGSATWQSWIKVGEKDLTELETALKAYADGGIETNNANTLASAYSDEATYKKGAMAVYNGLLYICTANIETPESFNADHWRNIRISDELAGISLITSSDDLNNFIDGAFCGLIGYSATPANAPNNSVGVKLFLSYNLGTLKYQLWFNALQNEFCFRYRSGSPGTWISWKTISGGLGTRVETLESEVETLESATGSLKTDFAAEYSTSAKYSAGDVVTFQNKLYTCLETVSSEADFDFSKWKQVSVGEVLDSELFRRVNILEDVETSFSNTRSDGVEFKLMDYNVAHYNNNSHTGIYILPTKEKYYNLKRLLNEYPVDCVVTQENASTIDNTGNDPADVGEKSALAYLYAPMYPAYSGITPGIYTKKTGGFQNFSFSNIPVEDGGGTVSCTVRRVKLTKNGVDLYVYTFLLVDSSNWKKRKAQLSYLIENCLEADGNPANFVFVGDFNTGTQGLSTLDDEKAFLHDLETEYSATLANGGYLGWQRTHSTSAAGALDNALVSNTCVITKFRPLGEWYPLLYSDHYPILLDVTVVNQS